MPDTQAGSVEVKINVGSMTWGHMRLLTALEREETTLTESFDKVDDFFKTVIEMPPGMSIDNLSMDEINALLAVARDEREKDANPTSATGKAS